MCSAQTSGFLFSPVFDLASRLVPVRWTIANCNILVGPAYIITFVAFGLFMLAASYKLVNRSLVYLVF